jgi:hypothetical protein
VGGFHSEALGLEGACDPLRVPSFAFEMASRSANVRVRLKISVFWVPRQRSGRSIERVDVRSAACRV